MCVTSDTDHEIDWRATKVKKKITIGSEKVWGTPHETVVSIDKEKKRRKMRRATRTNCEFDFSRHPRDTIEGKKFSSLDESRIFATV